MASLKYGVTGKGVTVVILDRGIDWRHQDFRNPDGTTRIKAILDMTGQNLCDARNPRPVEYTDAKINAALSGGPTISHRDAVGHGTATSGVAAGNGRSSRNEIFRGIAPDADLVIVKMTSEGAAAHGDQPAEGAFQGCLDEALDWVDRKVTQLGQPAVALINSGVQWGPIDGTSAVSRKIDAVFGLDRPGRVYVAASGDDGGADNHASATYRNSGNAEVLLRKASAETSYMQLWYSGATPAEITVAFDDGASVGPVRPGGAVERAGISVVHYLPGTEFYPWRSTSGDRAVWIRVIGHAGTGRVQVRAITPGEGRFDLYGDLLGPNLTPIISFTSGLVPGRLTDYAATRSAVSVADYVVRTSYSDIDGVRQTIETDGLVGHLWAKSSGDPTRDGRFNIDLAAPGENLFASLASGSYWASLRGNIPMEGDGRYVRFGGTSGSAPIVLGTVALMLQLRPGLTAREVKGILRTTAFSDEITGAVPNARWGYGKLDALRALRAVYRCGSSC
jgi:subtilisin family serine protease